MPQESYNTRLFSKGIRRQLHLGRYRWIANELKMLNCAYSSVFELGCHDGKLIDWLPNKRIRYLGLDANWCGGLDIARAKYSNISENYVFRKSISPKGNPNKKGEFDLSICMETFEHIPPASIDDYLANMAFVTKKYSFITVPNEIGIVFFFKTIAKRVMGCSRQYTAYEFLNHCIGRTDRVNLPNGKGGHKGFSYRRFLSQISRNFNLVKICGIPIYTLPPYFNFTVGIIAKPKFH